MSTAISVLGGVGLFLLGMTVMTEGLKGLAGSTLRKVLSLIGAAAKRTVHADASARVSRRRSGPRRYRSAPHATSGGRPGRATSGRADFFATLNLGELADQVLQNQLRFVPVVRSSLCRPQR